MASHKSKQHSDANDKGKILSFEKKKTRSQEASLVNTKVETKDESADETASSEMSNCLQKQDNSVSQEIRKFKAFSTKHLQKLTLQNNASKTMFHKKNQLKQSNKRDSRDFLSTVYIGYIVIALIYLFYLGVSTIGLAQTLLIVLGFVAGLIIFYSIGKLFRILLGF